MSSFLNLLIWFLFIFFTYHFIRGILTDGFNIHHPLIDINHRKPTRGTKLLGRFFKFWGTPFEVGVVLLSFNSIVSKDFGISGIVAVILFIFFMTLWVYTSF